MIADGQLKELLAQDQLRTEMAARRAFGGFTDLLGARLEFNRRSLAGIISSRLLPSESFLI